MCSSIQDMNVEIMKSPNLQISNLPFLPPSSPSYQLTPYHPSTGHLIQTKLAVEEKVLGNNKQVSGETASERASKASRLVLECPVVSSDVCDQEKDAKQCKYNKCWDTALNYRTTTVTTCSAIALDDPEVNKAKFQCVANILEKSYLRVAAKEYKPSSNHVGAQNYGHQATGQFLSWPGM